MMLTFRAGKSVALLLLLTGVAACSREQQDWRSAEAADTVESYDEFLLSHPESELAKEARTRVAQLSEDREWKKAGKADTADAYRQFLAQNPNGKWAQEARIRIQNFALNGLPPAGPPMATATEPPLNAAPPAVSRNGQSVTATLAAPGELAQAAGSAQAGAPGVGPTRVASAEGGVSPGELAQPAGPTHTVLSTAYVSSPNTNSAVPASPVPATYAASAGFGVQLGAFASQSAASSQWQVLSARHNAELRGLSAHIVSANTPTGPIFRLQALVADEARARALCDVLRRQAQPCVPVLPH